ncbi:hypothetical protein QYF91_03535, partial [Xanthomonas euvesicatoria]
AVVVASRRHSSPPTTVHNKPTTQYPSTPGFISNHWYGRWGQVNLTPGTDLATIAFAVPSAEGLLGGIEDKAHYRLLIDKKQVFEIEWHDGHQARDRLRQCIAADGMS